MHEGIGRAHTRGRRERGATGLEFAALLAVAAIVVGAVLFGVWNGRVAEETCAAASEVTQSPADCSAAGGPSGGLENPGVRDWFCSVFGWFCDGGDNDSDSTDSDYDGDLPDGLPADHEFVEILNSTEKGREILQWLADNDVEVIFDSSATGAYYDPALNAIVLGKGYENVTTLVHEYNHAFYARTGKTVNTHQQATSLTRADYVNGMLDEETASVVLEITTAREFTDAGHRVTHGQSSRYWDAHDDARQSALDQGKSQAEADAAGREAGRLAIRQMFVDGTYRTSNTGQTYEEYYGSYWDRVNP